MEVVCKICVKHDFGVSLWTGRNEVAVREAAAKKYAGQTLSFGEPKWVMR